MDFTDYRLVLASASPQRHQILTDAGFEFDSVDPGEAEASVAAAPTPEALALAKARAKALEVAIRLRAAPAIVAGVDTLVALGDEIIGKPLDRMDAVAILSRLSGTRHRVISGMCLWPIPTALRPGAMPGRQPLMHAVTTWIKMKKMSSAEIEAYVATGQSDGKAGAYAIQKDDRFVEGLEGSFLNVVGLPLDEFRDLLKQAERDLKATP